jgi:3-deoxy-D-manno-octulosonate 8-phosphate phosphatase KdsC-like HAD superfamily phosphatase
MAVCNKLSALRQLAQEHGLSAEQVAFMGNDLEGLGWVGMPLAVAVLAVRKVARFVTMRDGIVPKLSDLILNQLLVRQHP